jgi:Cys-Gly metallodipeptidase DUG1
MYGKEFPPAIEQYIDGHKQQFQDRLASAVAIPSVSADTTPEGRKHVQDMSDLIAAELRKLKNIDDVQQVPLGKQQGTDVDLPKLVIGTLGKDPKKKTILIYGHFDVQPV